MLDKALQTEHIPELPYPALTCVLPGDPSVKTPICCDSKFKQNLFYENQSQNFVDFLTLYDKSYKYKRIGEILVPLVFFICAIFWMLFKTWVCLWAFRKKWQNDRRFWNVELGWQIVPLCMICVSIYADCFVWECVLCALSLGRSSGSVKWSLSCQVWVVWRDWFFPCRFSQAVNWGSFSVPFQHLISRRHASLAFLMIIAAQF